MDPVQVAKCLRVSTKSAIMPAVLARGRRGGPDLQSPGGNVRKLDDTQLTRLRAALDLGPAAHGWKQDQRWTLARVTALIARLFHVSYTLRGTSLSGARWFRTRRRSARGRPQGQRPGAGGDAFSGLALSAALSADGQA